MKQKPKEKPYIQFCRYYHGETGCPKGVKESFWNYERAWVEQSMQEGADFRGLLEEYFNAGLRTFEQMDDTPLTLKATLFNRYSHWLPSDTEGFKKWYREQYIAKH